MTDPITVNPDALGLAAAAPDGAFTVIWSAGGPLKRLPFDRLLAKLVKTETTKGSRALLYADLAHAADAVALVHNDPTPGYNGWYRKTGASGAGAWVQFEVLTQAVLAQIEAAQDAVLAATNYAVSKAAGEAAHAVGEFFCYPDGAGGLVYAERTPGGSTEIARALTQANAQLVLASTAAISGGTFAAAITRVSTRGFAAANDGGAATYTRWTAGMAALAVGGEGVWWFTASDGSKWQLAENQIFTLPMFGAMGDPTLTRTTIAQNVVVGTNEKARIQAAMDAPMVRDLIITRQHWTAHSLQKPSGKRLVGYDRATCGIHVIPLVGDQAAPTWALGVEDDDSGECERFFINCQRSGWNPALATDNAQHLKNRCSGLVIRRDSRNVRISRVDVYNSWGYSHYTSAGAAGNAGPTPRNIVRQDCRAYNGDTCFQTTGLGITETLINCWGYKDPIDGGSSIYMECAFHSYSGVGRLHRIRCGFVGSAPAVLDSIADGLNTELIINEDCDFRTTGGQFAITVNNPDPTGVTNAANVGKKVLDYRIIRSRVAPDRVFAGGATPYAVHATYANVSVIGGTLGGLGIFAGAGAAIEVHSGPDVSALAPTGVGYGGISVVALTTDGGGTIDWYGKAGSVSAVNEETPALAATGFGNVGVTFHDLPNMTPAPGGSAPVYAEIVQRVVGNKTAAEMTNAGYSVPPNYWFTLDLPQPVASRDRTSFAFSLERDDNNTTGPEWSASIRWMGEGQVQVYVNSPGLAGCRLRYVVTEWSA